ncbi:hypothetical protein CEB3_c08030 [Peptococcaceae bacterium CEB3]|nr:hypothetical protein CEB3_c08030 [Peptococcaceae bacterium CEB3]
MRKVLWSALLAGILLTITFRVNPNLNPMHSATSVINMAQGTVPSPNIDPIEA